MWGVKADPTDELLLFKLLIKVNPGRKVSEYIMHCSFLCMIGEGKPAEVVWCFGQCFDGRPWAQSSMWMLLRHVADQVIPFMETVFPDGCGLFQLDKAPCHKAKMVQECFEEHNNKFEVLPWPQNSPRSQFNWASVGSAGQTIPIHGSLSLQLTGLKRSAANVLVLDTTTHLQGVHALTDQGRFGSKRGPTQY